LLLIVLHAVEGLQHGLHQLSLGGEQLLQVSVVVVVVVVAVAGLAVALAVPSVHHLMVWEKEKNEIPRNPTICTRDMGKCCHFIYLNIDEVVDKMPKHPTTLTNTHKQKHQ
jgi:predicted ferric reductase